jgi:Flp pilus assembly protein TadG
MDTLTRDRRRHSRGTEVVEAAILLPLLLMLVLGAIEYGWLLYNVQQITNAARQGARIAILPHLGAESEARTVLTDPATGLLAKTGLLDDLVSGYPTFTYTTIPGDPEGRREVTVQIRVSTANLCLINAPSLIPMPAMIGATVTMAKEGS